MTARVPFRIVVDSHCLHRSLREPRSHSHTFWLQRSLRKSISGFHVGEVGLTGDVFKDAGHP